MCIGIPSKVISVEGSMARVESFGEERDVSLILMAEEVSVGDYLLIQIGNFAAEIIAPQRAKEALEYLQQAALEEQF